MSNKSLFKIFTITFVAVIVGAIIYLLIYLGMFKPVYISISEEPSFHLIHKNHTGPYFKINPVIVEVEAWAKAHNIDCSKSFGEYFDHPDQVEEARLRSRGGCVVSEKPKELPADIEYSEYPARRYVKAIFEGSASVGPFKVYSKVEDFMKENKLELAGPVIEVYVIHSQTAMTTTYYFPLNPAAK